MRRLLIACVLLLEIAAAASVNLRRAGDIAISVDKADAAPSPFTVTLTNHDGVEYHGPISIGDQTILAIYDTGSYDIMAVSESCLVCRTPPGVGVYKSSASKTFHAGKLGRREHFFGGDLVVASQDLDTIHLGTRSSGVDVKNMPFWQVKQTTVPQWISNTTKFTAIVGLGHSSLVPDTKKGDPPVETLLKRAGTQVFSICLQKGPANPGFITFNPPYDFKSAEFKSKFKSVPLLGKSHWALELEGVSSFNGKFTDRRCTGWPKPCIAIVDSGTSLIGVPSSHMSMLVSILEKIDKDCSKVDYSKLPDLKFKLGGNEFSLPATAYVVALSLENGKKECYGAFMPFDLESKRGDVWVLGLPFLRQFFTVWDRAEPRLYITNQPSDSCSPLGATGGNSSSKLLKAVDSMQGPTIADRNHLRLPSWAHDRLEIL